MNLYSINYHPKPYTIFKIAKIPLEETNVSNRGTFGCRTVTTVENRNINVTFSGTSKYSTNLEHINLWIYGRNIRIYGYMEENLYI